MKNQRLIGNSMLLTAALIWGTSFFVLKNTLNSLPVCGLLAVRFTVGLALLSVIFWKKWRLMNRRLLGHGVLCGVLLGSAYIVQTFGLTETTPGKNAFLTAIYCVLTPFIGWIVFRKRPRLRNWIAAIMCLTGIGFVSLDGDLTVSTGEALTLLSGLLFALHIVAVNHYGQREDAVLLTILQFGTTAVMTWGLSFATETWPTYVPAESWFALGYLAVFCTTIAMLLQNVGESLTNASSAAILLSFESVFGAFFSVIFTGEQITLRLLFGFSMIFAAVLVSELQGAKKAASTT